MVLCPYCLGRVPGDRHDIEEKITRCPNRHCGHELYKHTVIPMIPFPDCVVSVKCVGLNSDEDANMLLRMMS